MTSTNRFQKAFFDVIIIFTFIIFSGMFRACFRHSPGN